MNVSLKRMASEEIADKRKMLELFTSLENFVELVPDAPAGLSFVHSHIYTVYIYIHIYVFCPSYIYSIYIYTYICLLSVVILITNV